jgi:ABC-2 type transport system permease protein
VATTVTAPDLGLGTRMLGNEVAKGLRVLWVHKVPLVGQLLYMSVTYWIVQFIIGGGRFVGEVLAMTLVAYLAYSVSYIASLRMVSGVLEEMYTGTLEQSLLSPLRPWVASTGRLAAAMVEALAVTAVVGAFNLTVMFTVQDVELPLRASALVPLGITVVDIAGFALLFGALALVVNSIGAVIHVVQNIILMLNGAIIPVFVFPGWLEVGAKVFIPSTLGVDATRQILVAGDGLGQVWAGGTLPLAVVHAAVLLVAGWVAYQAAIRRGLREGRLGA